jgi:hypothetical protein
LESLPIRGTDLPQPIFSSKPEGIKLKYLKKNQPYPVEDMVGKSSLELKIPQRF